MADTVNLPGFGRTSKQTAYMIGGVAVLVVGVAWYRSKNAAAAAAAPASSSTAADTGSSTAFDPAALAGTPGYGDAGTGYGGGYSGGGYGNPTPPAAYTTNAQWSQAAEDYLVNTVGIAPDVAGNALGKYLTGGALTPDQVNIVQQAIAFTNLPPVNGPTGYPPSFRTAPAPPTSGPIAAPAGLHVTSVTTSSIGLAWSAVPGVDSYLVSSSAGHSYNTTGTGLTVGGLRPRTHYTFWVQALSSGRAGPRGSGVSTTTK